MTNELQGTIWGTLSLGSLELDNDLGSDLEAINFPMNGSNDAEAYDYGNTKKKISLKGKIIDTNQANLADWVVKMETLQNGNQSTIILHLDFLDLSTIGDYTLGFVTVKVLSFRWARKLSSPNMVEYTLNLIESI